MPSDQESTQASFERDWLRFDREHVWHPYSSMTAPITAYPVRSAQGVRILLENGRELIDGMSSWWSAIHGYNHPVRPKPVAISSAINNTSCSSQSSRTRRRYCGQ